MVWGFRPARRRWCWVTASGIYGCRKGTLACIFWCGKPYRIRDGMFEMIYRCGDKGEEK